MLWWAGIGAILASLIGFTFDPNAKMLSYEISDIPYTHWLAYFGISIFGMLGYFCMTKALQMIDPTLVAFIRYGEQLRNFGVSKQHRHRT